VRVISVGEVLWDVFGESEHLGGAPFNFAAHLRRLGHEVLFVSAVGKDARGNRVLALMAEMGLPTDYVAINEKYPTGTVTVTLGAGGQPSFVIHRPAAYDFPRLRTAQFDALLSPPPDWIYFGTLLQMSSDARRLTMKLLSSSKRSRHFYDLNLRANSYDAPLVRDLLARASVVKLNDAEVPEVEGIVGKRSRSLEDFCRKYASAFGWKAVCVTTGAAGCVALVGDEYVESGGYPVQVADTIGAGDAFAAAFVHGLGEEWPARNVADFANRVGALVASRKGAIPHWTVDEARALTKVGERA
jgi:fructokinase